MGNQGSALGDEPGTTEAQRNLQHFDHTFKGQIHTSSGPGAVPSFGECSFQKREAKVTCKGSSLEIVEDVGLTQSKGLDIPYQTVSI